MRKLVLLAFGLLLLPAWASAQQVVENCPACTLSLYADAAMSTNCGPVPGLAPTDIYLGVKLSGAETGLTGIEFSVAGTDGFLSATLTPITDLAPTVLGDFKAPADTSATSTLLGGCNIAWGSCQLGTRLTLAKVTVFALSSLPDKVLTVMHKFAPTNPNYGLGGPVLTRCDAPTYTPVKIKGGYFIGNPSATPPLPCIVDAIQSQTWSAMKGLYR
jgi:hypothetical protein